MTVSEKMIAAAWQTWRSRHGGKLGPGPAFREAIEAAMEVHTEGLMTELKARLAELESIVVKQHAIITAWEKVALRSSMQIPSTKESTHD